MAKRRNNTLIYVLLGLVVVLVAFLVYQNKNKEKGERVIVEKVETRDIQEIVSASGKVFPQKEVKISSDVSGEVVELYVQEGDSVTVGQLLAKVDPDAYQSQVERGMANLNSSRAQMSNAAAMVEQLKASKEQIDAQLINAKEIHKRNEKLFNDGVISQADFDASLSNVRSLEANLRSAVASIKGGEESFKSAQYSVKSSEATLKELRTSLNRTTIFAPVSGIISKLNIEQGERVVGTMQFEGTEVMRIANLNAMEVRVDVTENDIPRVSLGNTVEIEVDAYLNRKFKGTVSQIAHSSSNSTAASLTSDQVTNFEVRINIDPSSYADLISKDKQYPFRPGMSATVDILTNLEKDVICVPIQSVTTREKDDKGKKGDEDQEKVTEDDLKEVIFLVQADTVHMQEVVTGIQDDNYIQILSGVSTGEDVVAGPYSAISRKLKQGDDVIPMSEEEYYRKNKGKKK